MPIISGLNSNTLRKMPSKIIYADVFEYGKCNGRLAYTQESLEQMEEEMDMYDSRTYYLFPGWSPIYDMYKCIGHEGGSQGEYLANNDQTPLLLDGQYIQEFSIEELTKWQSYLFYDKADYEEAMKIMRV